MRILVTGATGFVGTHVCQALAGHGHLVLALTHLGNLPHSLSGLRGLTSMEGDVLASASLKSAMVGIDAVIHLVGIIREFPARGITFERLHVDATQNVIAAARDAGVRRLVQMSALGTRPNAVSRYHQTKWAGEELVRASGLDWTVFRPSLIYGPGDGFTSTMVPLTRLPFFPVIGGGATHAEPVSIADVAEGFARAVDDQSSIGETFDIAGPDTYTYREIYRLITEATGRRFRPTTIPIWMVRPVAALLQYQPWFPLTLGQLQMLQEDNTGDQRRFPTNFGIEMTRLDEGLGFLRPRG